MAVIKRERPVVLTGQSATAFLKFKSLNEKKVKQHIEFCEKKAQEKGNNIRWNNAK